MNLLLFLLLALAGGAGAAARFVVDGLVRSRFGGVYPLGTTVINISGSLVLGLLTGLTVAHVVPEDWHVILGAGFLGGYTTFSTASFETVRLIQDGRYLAGLINGLGMLVACVFAATFGWWMGQLLA